MDTALLSGYERRIKVATDALVDGSGLDPEQAGVYARAVLYALDHIPETVR